MTSNCMPTRETVLKVSSRKYVDWGSSLILTMSGQLQSVYGL